jgi:putative alpha-1,2-mannosidase
MSSFKYLVLLLTCSTLLLKAAALIRDLTQYVDPFIGTEGIGNPGTAVNGGNVFPGAALPFGVVKFGIDTTAFDWTNVDANAGYTPDDYGR